MRSSGTNPKKTAKKIHKAHSLPEGSELNSPVDESPFLKVPTGAYAHTHADRSYPDLPTNVVKRSHPISVPNTTTNTTSKITIYLEGKKLSVPSSAEKVYISPQNHQVSYSQKNSNIQSPAAFTKSSTSSESSESNRREVILEVNTPPDDQESQSADLSLQQQIENATSFMQRLRAELDRKKKIDDAKAQQKAATENTSLLQPQESYLFNPSPPVNETDFVAIPMDETNTQPDQDVRTKVWEAIKFVSRGTIDIAASVPTALNAFANPLGVTPDQLSLPLLDAASISELSRASAEGGSSLFMNAIQLDFSLQVVWEELQKSLPRTLNSPKDAIINIASIIGSANAAIAAFAIAYAALAIPVSTSVGVASGIISLATTLVTRYLGAASALKAFFMFFNDNANLQTTFVDQVNHLDLEASKLNQIFELAVCQWIKEVLGADDIGATILNKLNDDKSKLSEAEFVYLQEKLALDNHAVEKIGDYLAKTLTEAIKDPQINLSLKEKELAETCCKKLRGHCGYIFDMSLGALSAFGVAPVYLQKGFDGSRILLGYAGLNLTSCGLGAKQWIGSPAAITTSLMYFFWGLQFRTICLNVITHLQEAWEKSTSKFGKDLTVSAIITTLAVLAWNGPSNIAVGALKSLDNISGIKPHTSLGKAIEYLNLVGGGIFVNLGSALKKYLQIFGISQDASTITVQQFLERLSQPNQHVVSPAVASQFRLFAQHLAPQQADNINAPTLNAREASYSYNP